VPVATIAALRTDWNIFHALSTVLILACDVMLFAMSRALPLRVVHHDR
jgi:hypothetical protein